MDHDDPAYPGQRDYTPSLLRLYDRVVLGPVATAVWRCPKQRLVDHYRRHVREPHLDVGPGTGYFLRHAGLTAGSRPTILDPNPTVLAHCARRLRALDLSAVEADVCRPLPIDGPFASAALNLVIHCLPGPYERKAAAVANVAAVLAPDGVLFGASVLGDAGPHTWLSRRVLAAFNRRGAFDNHLDSEPALRAMLEASFEGVRIDVVGSIAIFAATGPRSPAHGGRP
jgi:SAM-dependent methyltransferase